MTSTICWSRAASATATAFLAADLVDRLLIYRAPILIGEGKRAVGDIGLDALADAHGRWRLADARLLGIDRLEVYERVRRKLTCSPGSSPISAGSRPSSSAATCACAIACGYDMASVDLGASIACSGVCLTVVDKGDGLVRGRRLGRDAVPHRARPVGRGRARSTSSARCRVGDELGGHIVTGHVDGVGEVDGARADGGSTRLDHRRRRRRSARYIAAKGSIALDGVSLTVNEVEDAGDGRPLRRQHHSPHRRRRPRFGALAAGRQLNIEIDILARYLGRMLDAQPA